MRDKSWGEEGYLAVGLAWRWDWRTETLRLSDAMLAHVDMDGRYSFTLSVYWDMLMHDVSEIRKDNGRYWFDGKPVLNWSMLKKPETLDGVAEERDMLGRLHRTLLPRNGKLKYSVNPVCIPAWGSRGKYIELYACALSFDPETMTGSGIGFEALGKFITCQRPHGAIGIEEVRSRLICNGLCESDADRAKECGFLNLSCENGAWSYQSVWDG